MQESLWTVGGVVDTHIKKKQQSRHVKWLGGTVPHVYIFMILSCYGGLNIDIEGVL
jgi:hypothetical protein